MTDKSLIERAARRLEEMRTPGTGPGRAGGSAPRAGAALPAGLPPDAGGHAAPRANPVRSKVVELDLEALASAGFVTPNAPRSRVADEFRILKRPLIANASATGAAALPKGNLIMVTSAVPGEGKTFCSINLAMSVALEFDRSVLLVDADVARPSLPKVLGLSTSAGLLDVLSDGSLDLSRVLLRTNVESLSILSSGRSHRRTTESLASEAMARLLAEMSSRYPDRIIIFDSPPLLAATEAAALATQMGQVVLVVRAEKTLQAEVNQALAAIESCPVKMMILNEAGFAGQGGIGYGYGYGYGHEEAPDQAEGAGRKEAAGPGQTTSPVCP